MLKAPKVHNRLSQWVHLDSNTAPPSHNILPRKRSMIENNNTPSTTTATTPHLAKLAIHHHTSLLYYKTLSFAPRPTLLATI
jgi:hypothetical protein